MIAPEKTEAKADDKPAAPQKKSRWKKGLLIGAFALAVGALAYDDLSLRVDNYVLGTAVIGQQIELQDMAQKNAALKGMLLEGADIIGGLLEENAQLKEQIMGGAEQEDNAIPVVPQQKNPTILISTKAPKPLTKI